MPVGAVFVGAAVTRSTDPIQAKFAGGAFGVLCTEGAQVLGAYQSGLAFGSRSAVRDLASPCGRATFQAKLAAGALAIASTVCALVLCTNLTVGAIRVAFAVALDALALQANQPGPSTAQALTVCYARAALVVPADFFTFAS